MQNREKKGMKSWDERQSDQSVQGGSGMQSVQMLARAINVRRASYCSQLVDCHVSGIVESPGCHAREACRAVCTSGLDRLGEGGAGWVVHTSLEVAVVVDAGCAACGILRTPLATDRHLYRHRQGQHGSGRRRVLHRRAGQRQQWTREARQAGDRGSNAAAPPGRLDAGRD